MMNPDQLIADYLDDTLSASDEAALNAWLKEDDRNMRRFAAAVLLEQQIRAAAHVRQAQTADMTVPTPRSWLSRAAAGIGLVPLLNQPAAAAILNHSAVLVMKKTLTSAAAIILLAGGCGLYWIHQRNEASRTRSAEMETEARTLSRQLGLSRDRPDASSGSTAAGAPRRSAAEMIVILNKQSMSPAEYKQWQEVRDEIAAMDAESLKNLLLDAEKLRNPPDGRLAEAVMESFIRKDPAEASRTAVMLIGRGAQFQYHLSGAAEEAFNAWLEKDPAAADAWYAATAAANGFDSKAIPPNGLEKMDISRSLARIRFSRLAAANPAAAEAMLPGMVEEDTILAMQAIKDPAVVARLLPKLGAAARDRAAEGVIQSMAASDLEKAFAWAGTLDMNPQQRDQLLATGIESAATSGKLDLAGVKEWSEQLNLPADRLAKMQVFSALGASKVPGEKDSAVAWERVASHCAWLRAEAPPELASKSVGQYLGLLANPGNLDQVIEAYRQEAARQGVPDADLTIKFASYLAIKGSADAAETALKLLHELPASPERDRVVEQINLNR